MSFFAVFVPGHSDSPPSSTEKGAGDVTSIGDSPFVFREMNQVLEMMKKFKDTSPRFKNFPTYEEAVRFTVDGGGDVDDSPLFEENGSGYSRPSTPRPPPAPSAEEAPRPFPAPTRPQLTAFKKAIESKDIVKVREFIDGNPRYLINCNSDTPTILQEGFRYNALHVAARTGHLETLQAVLRLFKDETSSYVRRLYPDDRDEQTTSTRRLMLLDFYLNTPDKGCNDTPLHFAVKNGFLDSVRYLCSLQECNRMLVNKNGQTPKELVKESDRIPEKAKNEILRLLEQGSTEYYVPLYRARDEADAPILRRPTAGFPEKRLESDGKDGPDYRLAAYIGPISEDVANHIYAQWAFNSGNSPPGRRTPKKPSAKSESKAAKDVAAIKRSDLHKGMERIGRQISASGGYSWLEYWNFLRTFVDLRTDAGLKLLEQYFSQVANKDQANFESALQSRFARIDEEEEKDACRKKLDFNGINSDEDRDPDSSRDSSDLYFDAVETGDAAGGDAAASPGPGARTPQTIDHLWDGDQSGDGYFTPPQELSANVIVGQEPTKLDRDVFATLEKVKIDEIKYPRSAAWMRMISEFPDEERRRWVPLDSPRAAGAYRTRKSSRIASE